MSLRVKQLRSSTIDIQIVAEEHYPIGSEELEEDDILTLLERRILHYCAFVRLFHRFVSIQSKDCILFSVILNSRNQSTKIKIK